MGSVSRGTFASYAIPDISGDVQEQRQSWGKCMVLILRRFYCRAIPKIYNSSRALEVAKHSKIHLARSTTEVKEMAALVARRKTSTSGWAAFLPQTFS